MPDEKKITVYYDGSCPLCSAVVHPFDADTFDKRDVTKEPLPSHISPEQAQREVHVVDAAGKTYRGVDAVFRILDEQRGWRWLARVGRLPGFHFLAAATYAFVARNRYRFFEKK